MAGKPFYPYTSRERRDIEEKAKYRNEMKNYFQREMSNPLRHAFSQGTGHLEDPAIVRFLAHKTFTAEIEYLRPTLKNGLMFLAVYVIPMAGLTYLLHNHRQSFEKKCRSGEIAYRDRQFKFT